MNFMGNLMGDPIAYNPETMNLEAIGWLEPLNGIVEVVVDGATRYYKTTPTREAVETGLKPVTQAPSTPEQRLEISPVSWISFWVVSVIVFAVTFFVVRRFIVLVTLPREFPFVVEGVITSTNNLVVVHVQVQYIMSSGLDDLTKLAELGLGRLKDILENYLSNEIRAVVGRMPLVEAKGENLREHLPLSTLNDKVAQYGIRITNLVLDPRWSDADAATLQARAESEVEQEAIRNYISAGLSATGAALFMTTKQQQGDEGGGFLSLVRLGINSFIAFCGEAIPALQALNVWNNARQEMMRPPQLGESMEQPTSPSEDE